MNACHCKKNNSITYQYPGITIVKKKIHTQNKYCNKHQLFIQHYKYSYPLIFCRITDYLLADCPIFMYGKTIDTFCTSRLRKIEGSQADGQSCPPFGAYPFS